MLEFIHFASALLITMNRTDAIDDCGEFMRQKVLIALVATYLIGTFADYFSREGLKQGLWDKILWRDGALPFVSLAKGLLWPLRIFGGEKPAGTTAERLAAMLNSGNDYPLCGSDGCIQEIAAKGNTVIATYSIPKGSTELPSEMFTDRAKTAETIRPNALRDICGAIQPDFPDQSMQWASHYYTNDGKFLASILVSVSDCPPK